LHTVGDTGEHGSSTGEDDVAVKVSTNIEIALEDGVVAAVGRQYMRRSSKGIMRNLRGLVDTGSFEPKEGGLGRGTTCYQ
jgi:hypothetical protein